MPRHYSTERGTASTDRRWLLRCASRLLLATAMAYAPTAMADPPPSYSLTIDNVQQQAPQLCWAAVAQMAVAYTWKQSNLSLNRQVDQPLEAAYDIHAISAQELLDPASIAPDKLLDLPAQLACCTSDLAKGFNNAVACNRTGDPILAGLRYEQLQDGATLSNSEIKEQIGEKKLPFIFSWDFLTSSAAKTANGYHYLIAVGYDSTASGGFKLQVWDPSPTPWASGATSPASGLKYIRSRTYRNPNNYLGTFARHRETWKILGAVAPPPDLPPPDPNTAQCRADAPVAINRIPIFGPPNLVIPILPSVSFESLDDFKLLVDKSLSDRQRARFLKRSAAWVHTTQALHVGVPFPIVVLEPQQLLNPEVNLGRILARKTRALLYPIETDNQVVDSFLMTYENRHWAQHGYANNEITQRLAYVRATHAAANHRRPEEYFFVSSPQLRAFFVAFTQHDKIQLISITNDGSINVTENRPQPADDVINAIKVQLRRSLR